MVLVANVFFYITRKVSSLAKKSKKVENAGKGSIVMLRNDKKKVGICTSGY